MNNKTCFKCGEVKPLIDFYRHKEMADGHLNKCKACTKLEARLNYDAKREHYQAYHAERRKLPEVREQHRRGLQRNIQRYPEKTKARRTLSNAIRDRRFQRKNTCDICGSNEKIEAHHTDYSQPLNVQWLCVTCHGKTHRKPRTREAYV